MVATCRAKTLVLFGAAAILAACASNSAPKQAPGASETVAAASPRPDFPQPQQYGGFDAQKAWAHLETTVGYGPRPVGSEGNRKSQEYIKSQLAAAGCAVEEDAFESSTPIGRLKMKNIIGKAAGEKPEVILLLSHYETKNMPEVPDFVGASDPGSSVSIVLELARLICAPSRKRAVTYWFGFVDGEEAFGEWSDTNGTFGSRQLAAKLNASGELKKLKAVVLLDLVGDANLTIRREAYSTPWLKEIIWATAKRLGYTSQFIDEDVAGIEDDHVPFLRRKIPAVDLIDLDYAHWHTAGDTIDKISPRSLAIVGHVVLESLPLIEKKL